MPIILIHIKFAIFIYRSLKAYFINVGHILINQTRLIAVNITFQINKTKFCINVHYILTNETKYYINIDYNLINQIAFYTPQELFLIYSQL